MPRFREEKTRLRALLVTANWHSQAESELQTIAQVRGVIYPLLSFLARPELRWQAAWTLGKAVQYVALHDIESARIIVRRIMWSLNEDSGNIGWGMPEAMGCILAENLTLAKEYGRILTSYIRKTGHADNFIDHAPLRQGAYWAVGKLATAQPLMVLPRLASLAEGLQDEDLTCRAFAAFACAALHKQLTHAQLSAQNAELWKIIHNAARTLAQQQNPRIELLDGTSICTRSVAEIIVREF